jgi:uncharacterized membrane protein
VEAKSRPARYRWGREEVEFSRIVAFSDGVFAIAITLLVLNLHVPDHLAHGKTVGDALSDQGGNLFAYGLSFAVIARLWLVHHRFCGEITHFDSRLMGLNLLYLGFVVLVPFTSSVLGNHGNSSTAVIIYAADLALVNLVGTGMFIYAARAGLTLERFVRYVQSPLRLRNLVGAAIFTLSIPVALLSTTAATVMWLALFFAPSGNRREID